MNTSRVSLFAALGAVLLASILSGCQVGAQVATTPGNCSTVAEVLEDLNATTLLAILNTTGLLPNISSPSFRGTVLAPTDEAFDSALSVLSTTGGGGGGVSDEVLKIIRTIVTGHILPQAYPVLRGGTYPTMDNTTNLLINNTTRIVSARAADGSGSSPFANVLPTVTLDDLEGEQACNAYVYTIEGFVLVSPSIIPQLLSASG